MPKVPASPDYNLRGDFMAGGEAAQASREPGALTE